MFPEVKMNNSPIHVTLACKTQSFIYLKIYNTQEHHSEMNFILKKAETRATYLYINYAVILTVIFCTLVCSLEFLVHWTATFESLLF